MKKRILLYILSLLLIAGVASAEFFSDVIVTSPNGIWTDSRAYATLNDAITAVGANDREIVIVSPQVVTTLTIPSTVRLKFLRDGSITNSGYLNIQTKNISADNRQIFTGVGNIDFAAGTAVKTGWFSNIESAFALTTNDTVTLIVSKPQTITASYSPGTNVHLKWEAPGNILTTIGGVVVGNLKNIEAGNYQIFAGAGDFDFLDGAELKLNWFNRLSDVLTWVENEKVTIIVNEDSIVQASIASAANETIKVISGGGLNLDAGVVLTINGSFSAELQQVFSGTGNVTGTPSTDYVYPEWFGAIGDGIIDDTVAINKADIFASGAGLPLKFGSVDYKVTTLTPTGQSRWYGTHMLGMTESIERGTSLIGTAGSNIIDLPDTGAAYELNGLTIQGFFLLGGQDHIYASNGGIWIHLKDLTLHTPSRAGIHFTGFVQNFYLDNVYIQSGQYGLWHENVAGSGGAASEIDNSYFDHLWTIGQSINGIHMSISISTNVSFTNTAVKHSIQDGLYIDGSVREWTFNNFNTERNHYGGAKVRTTGTINNGSVTLTVASAAGISIGDVITVALAVLGGSDLVATADNIVGNVITLSIAATTSVVSQDVTNAIYSNVKFANSIADPVSVTFTEAFFSTGTGGDQVRYAVDHAVGGIIVYISCRTYGGVAPIYSPDYTDIVLGGEVRLRTRAAYTLETFKAPGFPKRGKDARVVSPIGGHIMLGLRDGNDNGTGGIGNIFAIKYDAARTFLMYLQGSTGNFSVLGKLTPNRDTYSCGIMYGVAAPGAGTYLVGDMIFNAIPAIGQPKGWQCTVAGTPGTWVSMGNL